MNALVKRQPRETAAAMIQRWTRAAEDRKVSRVEIIPSLRPTTPVVQQAPAVHDLLRFCAVLDLPWVARYIRQPNGLSVYGNSFWLEKRHEPHYRPEDVYTLLSFEVGKEQCPCGAHTPLGKVGCVWCPACASRICYGRTTPSGYFQCRNSCGNRGQCREYPEREFALTPRLRR